MMEWIKRLFCGPKCPQCKERQALLIQEGLFPAYYECFNCFTKWFVLTGERFYWTFGGK